MKILLDECLPLDFRHSFPLHDAHSAERAGLKGRKNGELLRSAEAAGYNVLLTIDQGIPHQQPSGGRTILDHFSPRANQPARRPVTTGRGDPPGIGNDWSRANDKDSPGVLRSAIDVVHKSSSRKRPLALRPPRCRKR